MIIDSVDFYNVGAFSGSQSVQLTPSSPGYIPVVLVGGQNGRGKTTLLDGIHYALYGRNARLAKRGDLSWDDFLKGLIHRHAPRGEGAAIALRLRFHSEGIEHQLKIQREWKISSGRVKETLAVWMDGALAPEVAEDWMEFVENLIPLRIAHLFLFDGEQIAALADPERSREILRTGIYGLLGADLLDRLDKDLLALGRRYRMEAAPKKDLEAVEKLEADYLTANHVAADFAATIERINREIVALQIQREDLQASIQSQGGHLLDRRQGLEHEEQTLKAQIDDLESEIRRLQGGLLPLVTVKGLLEDIAQQAEREMVIKGGQEWLSRLSDRDTKLLRDLNQLGLPAQALKQVESWLEVDRQALSHELQATEKIYEFSPEGYAQLQQLLHGGLQETSIQFEIIQVRLTAQRDALERAQRNLARIPDPEAVRHLLDERDKVDRQLGALEFEVQTKVKLKAEADSNVSQLERQVSKRHDELESVRVGNALQRRNLEHLSGPKIPSAPSKMPSSSVTFTVLNKKS